MRWILMKRIRRPGMGSESVTSVEAFWSLGQVASDSA